MPTLEEEPEDVPSRRPTRRSLPKSPASAKGSPGTLSPRKGGSGKENALSGDPARAAGGGEGEAKSQTPRAASEGGFGHDGAGTVLTRDFSPRHAGTARAQPRDAD